MHTYHGQTSPIPLQPHPGGRNRLLEQESLAMAGKQQARTISVLRPHDQGAVHRTLDVDNKLAGFPIREVSTSFFTASKLLDAALMLQL